MYADYTYYQTEYGGKMSAADFKRFGRRAERRIDSLTGGKLQFAFPTNERDIEAVRDCVCELADFLCQIDLYNNAAMESIGTVAQADGTVKGKVITSISSGSESRSYSASGTANTSVTEAAKDKKVADTIICGMVQDNLGGVPDYNRINLLYAGAYPYSTKVVNAPPENKPTPEPPEVEPEPPTDTGDTDETEKPDGGEGEDKAETPEDIYFTDSVVVYNMYVNGLREETQYFGTRFDNVRIEFTQEENQNKAGKEDTSVCILKIKNDDSLPKPFLDPRSWEHLTTDEMLQYFTLDVDGDFFVIVKRKGLNLDVQAPVGVCDSNAYDGNFFEYMKQNYGYVYSMNSFEQFEGIPYFQVGGI